MHGCRAGRPDDLFTFRAAHLHEKLGYNVILPVLPAHGTRPTPASTTPGSTRWRTSPSRCAPSPDPGARRVGNSAAPADITIAGTSLGGPLAAMVAGLEPSVSSVLALVPMLGVHSTLAHHMDRAGELGKTAAQLLPQRQRHRGDIGRRPAFRNALRRAGSAPGDRCAQRPRHLVTAARSRTTIGVGASSGTRGPCGPRLLRCGQVPDRRVPTEPSADAERAAGWPAARSTKSGDGSAGDGSGLAPSSAVRRAILGNGETGFDRSVSGLLNTPSGSPRKTRIRPPAPRQGIGFVAPKSRWIRDTGFATTPVSTVGASTQGMHPADGIADVVEL